MATLNPARVKNTLASAISASLVGTGNVMGVLETSRNIITALLASYLQQMRIATGNVQRVAATSTVQRVAATSTAQQVAARSTAQ